MSDDDEQPQADPGKYFDAPTTRKLFRLVPSAVGDLSRASRQTAVVAANSEEEARLFASDADPFRHAWRDPAKFNCEMMDTTDDHVVGDVVFRSEPVSLRSK
jgi:hypothetical protein